MFFQSVFKNMRKTFILLLLVCHVASAVKHCLRYYLTASSGLQSFSEFVGFSEVDGVRLVYCDSNQKIPEPKQGWAKKLFEDEPQRLEWYSQECVRYQYLYRANIDILKQQLNQTEGVHIFQRMHGCEWDDETGEAHGFNQFGYDGEDFLSLDPETMTWVAAKPQAVFTKHKWDRETVYLQAKKMFNTLQCPARLNKYQAYLKIFPQSTDLPSVSLLQKSPSSPVSCHATGFYPDRADMFWRKDGEEIHEDVDHGEILPNTDGTFQMNVDLNISSVKPEDWSRYDCVFQLSGVESDIIVTLDKAVIRTNWVSPSEFPAAAAVRLVVVGLLLLLAVCISGLFMWRKTKNGFRPANSSHPSLDSSTETSS